MNDETEPTAPSPDEAPLTEADARALGELLRDVEPASAERRSAHLAAALDVFDDQVAHPAPVRSATPPRRRLALVTVSAAAAIVAVVGVGIGIGRSSESKNDAAETAAIASSPEESADRSVDQDAVGGGAQTPAMSPEAGDAFSTSGPADDAPDLGAFPDDAALTAALDTATREANDSAPKIDDDAVTTTADASMPGTADGAPPVVTTIVPCPAALEPDTTVVARALVAEHPVIVLAGAGADRLGGRFVLVDLTDCSVRVL